MIKKLPKVNLADLYQLATKSLLDLATEEGINASSKEEVYGCIFGRDSAITVLKILRANKRHPQPALLEISRRTLLTLATLQGKEFNLESGEEPGKLAHEFRKDKYEHLLKGERPWFIYPNGLLKNYDSIDATPLGLIAFYKYWQITNDQKFLITILPHVEAAINWIITYGDIDKDHLLEYDFPTHRKSGGLNVQSWTDSHESLRQKNGLLPKYPIAPIEAQAFAWLALKLWGDFYQTQSPKFSQKILSTTQELKLAFNKKLIFKSEGYFFGAQALDGDKEQIKTVTANPLLCLWAAYTKAYTKGGKNESIVEDEYIPDFVKRAFLKDLFVKDAGIRTMSSKSPTFNPCKDSYHNGSFWPFLNGMVVEGLENFGFYKEANKLKQASLLPFRHFHSPIELYNKDDSGYTEYCSPSGQKGCHLQAWSAAALLDMASPV